MENLDRRDQQLLCEKGKVENLDRRNHHLLCERGRGGKLGRRNYLLAGLLSVRCAPVSEGTKACKEAKA